MTSEFHVTPLPTSCFKFVVPRIVEEYKDEIITSLTCMSDFLAHLVSLVLSQTIFKELVGQVMQLPSYTYE